jgi:uncharacterized protein YndB with AHSA1/START domain
MTSRNKPNELYLTRLFEAPVNVVWEAWTDPAQVAQWWGPRGFTITTHSKDLRPGGHWHYMMHGPDGTDYPNKTVYHEVEKYAKLVYDHGGNDEQAPLFRVTVLFSESDGKTKMDMTMALATAQAAEEIKQFIKKAGGNTTWDRLAEYLEKETSGKDTFVIARTFDAPRDIVFDMWVKPEHFSQWLPPTGFTMQFIRTDVRTGGKSSYSMTGNNGVIMYGRVEYHLIQKPDCLVYTQQFCDENESISRHPMSPTWPETMLTTVQLAEEAPDKTRVTVTWEVYGKATSEELATFIQAKAGMTQGWTGSFDKLEAYLSMS